MAKICPNCGGNVPKFVIIDGKKHNSQRRKYCLKCSPFGDHNTSKLEVRKLAGKKTKNCTNCGKEHDQKANLCFMCYSRHRLKLRLEKVQSIVGDVCWICGYDKTWRNICFHHIDPKTKLFCLTSRELTLKWDRVLTEMKKCILVCANCHGEIHEGLINEQAVSDIWSEKWRKHDGSS